jgi:hypothetical protein
MSSDYDGCYGSFFIGSERILVRLANRMKGYG